MKILHFADIHSRDKDIEEVSKCLGFIVEKAMDEKPDLIVFAGDFFHSRDVKLDSEATRLVIRSFSELADIAPVAAVIGTPLHDGKAPEILEYVTAEYPIHIATIPEQIYFMGNHFYTGLDGCTRPPEAVISLLPQPTKEYFSRTHEGGIVEGDQSVGGLLGGVFMGFGATAAEFKAPHILVFHGTANGARICNGQRMIGREIEISREAIELCRADLGCFGHIHLPQEAFPNMFYASSIYPENIGEDGKHGFWIHGWEGGKIWSKFVETPYRKVAEVKIDLTGDYDLQAGLANTDFTGVAIRVQVRAWQDETNLIDKPTIERVIMAKGALKVEFSAPIRVPRETVRSTEIMKLSTLPDKVKELARTRGEEVPASILEKADLVERVPADQILEKVQNNFS